MAQQWAEAAQQGKKEVQIPERYREYEEIFSEEAAKRFPPSRPEDHAIKLKPGAPETVTVRFGPFAYLAFILDSTDCRVVAQPSRISSRGLSSS
jgi:hypothetical protein